MTSILTRSSLMAILVLVSVAPGLEAQSVSQSGSTFLVYAPPNAWGPEVIVATHMGPIHYSITATPIGSTKVYGRVTYYSEAGWITRDFVDWIRIETGNAIAHVRVQFKGVPMGTSVRVNVR